MQLSIASLLSPLPSHWETLQDTDIPVTSWLPQEQRLLLWPEHRARGWGQLLPTTACLSLVDFGFCLSTCGLSAAPNPVINFKIYYGSDMEATPCHSFYIF